MGHSRSFASGQAVDNSFGCLCFPLEMEKRLPSLEAVLARRPLDAIERGDRGRVRRGIPDRPHFALADPDVPRGLPHMWVSGYGPITP